MEEKNEKENYVVPYSSLVFYLNGRIPLRFPWFSTNSNKKEWRILSSSGLAAHYVSHYVGQAMKR